MELNKIKDFVLKDKVLSALLLLDLISFIITFIIGIFISTMGILFFFLIFITATYLIILFEKHALKIFIVGIVLLIISFVGGMFPHSIFALLVLLITFVYFTFPQSLILLILKNIKLFERQSAIVKTIVIDAIILITILIGAFIFSGFSIPSL